jgi:hypothetical protein
MYPGGLNVSNVLDKAKTQIFIDILLLIIILVMTASILQSIVDSLVGHA